MDTYKKKYKELVAWINLLSHSALTIDQHKIVDVILERSEKLKESEDERVKRCISDVVRKYGSEFTTGTVTKEKMLAWLEKQGEQKETLCDKCKKAQPSHSCQDITALGRCYIENINASTNKNEPKFKVGDWITDGYLHNKITDVLDDRYIVDTKFAKRSSIPFKYENNYHLWTIADAKEGDVLYSPTHRLIWIYKDTQHYYACVNMNYITKNVATDGLISIPNDVCPSTTDQRAILFSKMEGAGYKWDSEKRELKKISQCMISAWAKETMYNKPTDNDMKEALRTEYEKCRAYAIA